MADDKAKIRNFFEGYGKLMQPQFTVVTEPKEMFHLPPAAPNVLSEPKSNSHPIPLAQDDIVEDITAPIEPVTSPPQSNINDERKE